MNRTTYYTIMPSPIDDLLLVSDGEALTSLRMETRPHGRTVDPTWKQDQGPFREVQRQLQAYFAGELSRFDVPVRLDGTDFQQAVWAELRRLRFGERVSYGELARRIGRPGASRAVGSANGQNSIAILVPCHRVVGAGDVLGGYGGGLGRKRWLLEHEALASGLRFERGSSRSDALDLRPLTPRSSAIG
jgi:methylated-DNA-[protein]-cysteine S-methyltransferase